MTKENSHILTQEVSYEFRDVLSSAVGVALIENDVATLLTTDFAQSLPEAGQIRDGRVPCT